MLRQLAKLTQAVYEQQLEIDALKAKVEQLEGRESGEEVNLVVEAQEVA